jgi:hypothetical protein
LLSNEAHTMYPARPEIVTVVCSAAVLSGRASIDGHELWRVNRDEIDTWSTPLVGDGMVFVMSGFRGDTSKRFVCPTRAAICRSPAPSSGRWIATNRTNNCSGSTACRTVRFHRWARRAASTGPAAKV